jgi:SRSO17 transposase
MANDTKFREGITELGLLYAVGVQSSVSVVATRPSTVAQAEGEGIGRPTKLLCRNSRHAPISVRELAIEPAFLRLEDSALAGRNS